MQFSRVFVFGSRRRRHKQDGMTGVSLLFVAGRSFFFLLLFVYVEFLLHIQRSLTDLEGARSYGVV